MKGAAYLFSDWKRIAGLLRNKSLYLFLDYDGTLAPIAPVPGKALIPKRTKNLLEKLSNMTNCKIAVVSGRALGDIAKRVGLKNIVYVGNHGFEVKGSNKKFKSPLSLRYRKLLDIIKGRLEERIGSIKGALIEDKGFSLSVHYRLADQEDAATIKKEFRAAVFLHELDSDISVRSGKMVLEIMPPVMWDKGKVVLWLLGRQNVFPVYVGDDTTDEDPFEAIRNMGLTVFVGKPKNTKARFYLKDTAEVARFLEMILSSLREDFSLRR